MKSMNARMAASRALRLRIQLWRSRLENSDKSMRMYATRYNIIDSLLPGAMMIFGPSPSSIATFRQRGEGALSSIMEQPEEQGLVRDLATSRFECRRVVTYPELLFLRSESLTNSDRRFYFAVTKEGAR